MVSVILCVTDCQRVGLCFLHVGWQITAYLDVGLYEREKVKAHELSYFLLGIPVYLLRATDLSKFYLGFLLSSYR